MYELKLLLITALFNVQGCEMTIKKSSKFGVILESGVQPLDGQLTIQRKINIPKKTIVNPAPRANPCFKGLKYRCQLPGTIQDHK